MMPAYPWDELATLWTGNAFGSVHDWLGARWNRLIQERKDGHADRDACFLQGLAFAALAFHFTQSRNQEGARILAADAIRVLEPYGLAYAGVAVQPILESARLLRAHLDGLDDEADCPLPVHELTRFAVGVPA